MGINAEKWEKKESAVILTGEEYSALLSNIQSIMYNAVGNLTDASVVADDAYRMLYKIRETSRVQIESITEVLNILC